MSTILAIDLGGTRLRAGLASSTAPSAVTPIGEWRAPPNLSEFAAHVASLLAAHGADRLGLGIPGLARGTTCIWVPNLGYLDGQDIGRLFPGLAIGLGNDAQLALLAEAEAGAAKGLTDALLLAIGTGIGSAVLAGGRILRGAGGGACSFGWASADLSDPGEDQSGWLERHASGRALDRAAAGLGLPDGAALIAAARAGNAAARAALAPAAQALGTTLAGAVALLDPQAIILAGGVASALDVIGPPLRAALQRQLPPHLRGIAVRQGHFGPGAGLVGAAIAGGRGTHWEEHHG